MSPSRRIAPWQIWWIDLGTPIGHDQAGLRPAIVVGSTTHCRFPIDMALVVPLTTRDRGLDHHVLIESPGSGLEQPSWARTEDIRVVTTARFIRSRPIGMAANYEIERLSGWLCEMVAFC